jgi:hypothetical protein
LADPVTSGRVITALLILAFTGLGIGEALAGVLLLPRWPCNLAGCAIAIWLIKKFGEVK